jgi:hypothetical protein
MKKEKGSGDGETTSRTGKTKKTRGNDVLKRAGL